MKKEILEMILTKIKECESSPMARELIVDRIDVVALKELYNDILKLPVAPDTSNECNQDMYVLEPHDTKKDIYEVIQPEEGKCYFTGTLDECESYMNIS